MAPLSHVPEDQYEMLRHGKLRRVDKMLIVAARLNDWSRLREVLEAGADPNACKRDGVAAVHIAAEKGYYRLLEQLIRTARERGTPLKLDSRTVFGNTPLVLAAQHDRPSCLEVLLEAGADPNAPHTFGRTPIHVAAFLGRAAIAERLIGHGADVNAVDCFDKTPLLLAISSRSITIVKWLLQAGADPNFRSRSSTPLLTLAVLSTTRFRDMRLLTFLLSAGADVRAADNVKFDTALHQAAMTGFMPAIDLLVAAGADLSATNAYGETPLNVAIKFRNKSAALHIYLLEEELEERELAKLHCRSKGKMYKT